MASRTCNSNRLVSPEISASSPSNVPLSTELRTGIILQEALTRYNHNAVPFWSSLYGTYLMPGPGVEYPEEVTRNIEWPTIISDFCKIPHDNRLNLCFRAPMGDIAAMMRVRNFMSHFHKQDHLDSLKGDFFNIWDWFDTRLSAYWYLGRKESAIHWDPLVQHKRSFQAAIIHTVFRAWLLRGGE